MKKDKKWAIKKLETRGVLEDYGNEDWVLGYNQASDYAVSVINQLEEPEQEKPVTQEEAIWFDEAAERLGVAVVEKPVIPQFVADWIERSKNTLTSLSYALTKWGDEDEPIKFVDWFGIDDNEEVFARAWIDGYEVEKEKLYRVRLPITIWDEESSELQEHWYYLVYDNTSDETRLIQSLRAYEHYQAELSETLIKSIDERYWDFAEEVTE